MRPVIGITCPRSEETWGIGEQGRVYDYVGRDYSAAIYQAGGFPVLIPAIADEEDLEDRARQVLQMVDGLFFSGGGDRRAAAAVSEIPTLYNQQPIRSRWEDTLVKLAYEQDTPCLGVCRGYQMMAVAFGGAMDTLRLPEHRQTLPAHQGVHNIYPASMLAAIVGDEPWFVNSLHVERVRIVPEDFTIAARAEDGSIEAIAAVGKTFFLGTQFHPELMPDEPKSQAIFRRLIDAACTSR